MSDFSNEFVSEFVFYAGRRRVDGTLILTTIDVEDLDRGCFRNLERLRSRHDDQSISALMVSNVRVEPEARRTGVGLALYEAAAKFARDRFNAAIVANDCYGGQTSDDAKGLWDSAKLANSLDVYGHVALWRHKAKPVRKAEEAKVESPAMPAGADPDRADISVGRTAVHTTEGTFYVRKHVDPALLGVFRWPNKRSYGDLSYADWLGTIDVAGGNVYVNSSASNGRYVGYEKSNARRRMLRAVIASLRSA